MNGASSALARPWALVPVKRTAQGKQRLGVVLSAESRRRLVLAMLDDVLTALSAVVGPDGLAGIVVVTDDPAAASMARRHDASVIADPVDAKPISATPGGTETGRTDGYSWAVAAGLKAIIERDAGAALVLPADVPLLSPEEVRQLLDSRRSSTEFIIAPARDGRGSNAILIAPPNAIPLVFDGDSFSSHLLAAQRAGIAPTVLHLPGLALDIDEPGDLLALTEHSRAAFSHAGRLALDLELASAERLKRR